MSERDEYVLTAGRLGRMFGKGPSWGYRLLRAWDKEQIAGGPKRVFWKRSGTRRYMYTTVTIVEQWFPRAIRDNALERRLSRIEKDLDRAYARISELEKAKGWKR